MHASRRADSLPALYSFAWSEKGKEIRLLQHRNADRNQALVFLQKKVELKEAKAFPGVGELPSEQNPFSLRGGGKNLIRRDFAFSLPNPPRMTPRERRRLPCSTFP